MNKRLSFLGIEWCRTGPTAQGEGNCRHAGCGMCAPLSLPAGTAGSAGILKSNFRERKSMPLQQSQVTRMGRCLQELEDMSWVEPLVQAGQLTEEDLPAVRDGLLQMHAWWMYFSLDRSAISRAHQQGICALAKKCHADPPQWSTIVMFLREALAAGWSLSQSLLPRLFATGVSPADDQHPALALKVCPGVDQPGGAAGQRGGPVSAAGAGPFTTRQPPHILVSRPHGPAASPGVCQPRPS